MNTTGTVGMGGFHPSEKLYIGGNIQERVTGFFVGRFEDGKIYLPKTYKDYSIEYE